MTIIALTSNGINGDYEILFEDENDGGTGVVGLQMIRRASGATTTVHTTRNLYSAVADKTDEFRAMGLLNPMLPTTPNEFTMENGAFFPRSSTEFLRDGAIRSTSWTNNIRTFEYTIGTDFIAGDIGDQVTQAVTGDTGTLLDFETMPDGSLRAWIRPDDPTPVTGDLFDTADAVTVVGGSAASVTPVTPFGVTGESLYSSMQVIGGVPSATEVYVVQDRLKMSDSTGGFQWWNTDTTVSLGIIDILLRVQLADTFVDLGNVSVFGRRPTSLYDHFTLDISGGGRSALPLASAPDINDTVGHSTFTGSAGSGTFLVGDVITEGVSGATGVLTAVAGTVANPILDYYLVGDLTDIFSSGAQTVTGAPSGATCTSAAPTANLGGPNDPAAGESGSVTFNYGTALADHDGDGTNEPYSVTVDTQNDVPVTKVYPRMKYLLRRGSGDPFNNTIGMDGEQYRGIQLQAQYDATQGIGISDGGFLLTVSTGSPPYSARSVSENTTDTYVMLTDQRASPALADNDILEQTSGNGVTIFGTPLAVPEVKNSPFGTFTGGASGIIFGATGILFINPNSGESQQYRLLDDNQVLRIPPNLVSITAQNTAAGDRVLAARDTGTAGIIDKDQFSGVATGVLGALTLTVTGSIDGEVPPSGFVRVLTPTGLQEEHHYVYDSRTTGASGVFTLRDVNEGTGVTSGSSTQLIDTTATFTTSPVVEVGMLVRNTTVGSLNEVWEVTNVVSATTLDVQQLYPVGAADSWTVADTYQINRLIGRDHAATPANYTAADDLYDLILDEEATGSSVTNSLVQSTTFGVVFNIRQGKVILPFTQNATVDPTGAVVTVVRSPDTIAT